MLAASSKVTQESDFGLNGPVSDVCVHMYSVTIMPLGHHNTHQMSCPEVGNDCHTSTRRIGNELRAPGRLPQLGKGKSLE